VWTLSGLLRMSSCSRHRNRHGKARGLICPEKSASLRVSGRRAMAPVFGLNGVGGSNPRLGGEAACGGGLGLKQQLSIGT
jgi:hypothetical protein